jgi:hypothetical protein
LDERWEVREEFGGDGEDEVRHEGESAKGGVLSRLLMREEGAGLAIDG